MSGCGEPAREELIRAEARILNAHAAGIERLLACIVAFAVVLIVAGVIGDRGLVATCLFAIAVLGGVVRGAKGPPGRGRSSVM